MSTKVKMDKLSITVLVTFGFLFLGFSLLPMALSHKNVKVAIQEQSVKIKSLYGRSIEYSNIKEVALASKLPSSLRRKKAISVNGIRKGLYSNNENDIIYIYLDRNYSLPFVKVVELDSSLTYFSIGTNQENKNMQTLIKNQIESFN